MQAENGRRFRIVEDALLDHQPRAPFLAGRRTFLGRLKEELDGAGKVRLEPRQDLGHAEQDGDVGIVPTGVHHAHLLAVVGGLHLRGEGNVDLLGDGQRVHVRP